MSAVQSPAQLSLMSFSFLSQDQYYHNFCAYYPCIHQQIVVWALSIYEVYKSVYKWCHYIHIILQLLFFIQFVFVLFTTYSVFLLPYSSTSPASCCINMAFHSLFIFSASLELAYFIFICMISINGLRQLKQLFSYKGHKLPCGYVLLFTVIRDLLVPFTISAQSLPLSISYSRVI